jgi:hypothetical protein
MQEPSGLCSLDFMDQGFIMKKVFNFIYNIQGLR